MVNVRLFLLFLLVNLTLPGVNAQVSITSHNITYELGEGEVIVKESIIFENPLKSTIHTFDETVTLLRGNAENILISGVEGYVNNMTSSTIIYLDFSKSPIYSTATKNTKTVSLTYTTKDFTSEFLIDSGRIVNVFSGNVLLPLAEDIGVADTHIKIKAGKDYQLGVVLPQAEVKEHREVSYFMAGADREIYTGFIVEIQYANFKDEALLNVDIIERRLDDAKRKAEDAESAILNAGAYNANTSKAQDELNSSLIFINESETYLTLAETLLEQRDFYQAYLYTNASVHLAQNAIKTASSAQKEANLQLQTSINKKISQLENLTATTSPSPTLPPPKKEITETRAPPTLTITPPPEGEIEPISEGKSTRMVMGAAILIFLVVLAVLALPSKRRRQKKERLAEVRDFRSISDLKRKSYKDFEEKMVDVKKETTIAGEIRQLSKEREKYDLGVENLKKKRLAGEIDENLYKAEKTKFENHIKKLDKKISTLEKELPPKKGGLDGKDISD
jgi:hypothetical protein